MFIAVFSVFIVATLVLVVLTLRWAIRRDREGRAAQPRDGKALGQLRLEFFQRAVDVGDGAFDHRESRGEGLVDQGLDPVVHAVIDAAVDLVAQTRVEGVDERLGQVLQAIAQVLDLLAEGVGRVARIPLGCVVGVGVSSVSLMGPDYGVVGGQ